MRSHSDTAEIEPVRVPASLDRDVGMRSLVRMAGTSSMKKFELLVGQIEFTSSKFGGKFGGPRPVGGISSLIDSPAVVKNGEELHDLDVGASGFGQPKSIFHDSRPMRDPMSAVPRQPVLVEDCFEDSWDVEGHLSRSR